MSFPDRYSWRNGHNGSDKSYAHGPLEGELHVMHVNSGFSRYILTSASVCSPQVTVYDQEYFQGSRMEFTASCQNIMEYGMENIRSLKVECGVCVSIDTFGCCFFIYSCKGWDDHILCLCLIAGWATSIPASVANSLSWRRVIILASRPTVAATPIALRGCFPSGQSAVL